MKEKLLIFLEHMKNVDLTIKNKVKNKKNLRL